MRASVREVAPSSVRIEKILYSKCTALHCTAPHERSLLEECPSQEFQAQPSGFAMDLPAVEHPPVLSPDPGTWKCFACDLTSNLWLNLSTGVMACGRQ